jgi:hypothetical protein
MMNDRLLGFSLKLARAPLLVVLLLLLYLVSEGANRQNPKPLPTSSSSARVLLRASLPFPISHGVRAGLPRPHLPFLRVAAASGRRRSLTGGPATAAPSPSSAGIVVAPGAPRRPPQGWRGGFRDREEASSRRRSLAGGPATAPSSNGIVAPGAPRGWCGACREEDERQSWRRRRPRAPPLPAAEVAVARTAQAGTSREVSLWLLVTGILVWFSLSSL